MKRLRELRDQYGFPAAAEAKLSSLVELIATDPEAPTSVTEPGEAIDAHVADSLSALTLIDRSSRRTIVDIGSGAGFPGLPLAVALEGTEVDLLESTARKCRFMERVIERLELRNARVVCARAEEWGAAAGAERYEVALARAVASLATLVEYASPLLSDGGVLIAWKGARDPASEQRGSAAAVLLGMSPGEVLQVTPFSGAHSRHLHVFEKTGPTPEGVPRRPGMARKRPLGRPFGV